MRKQERALETVRLLEEEYPIAKCSLDYDDAWKLLVSVRLAAQCTDARVNQITPVLFDRFPGIAALAAADVDEIEEIVHPCGLGKSKARDIKACMTMLVGTFPEVHRHIEVVDERFGTGKSKDCIVSKVRP